MNLFDRIYQLHQVLSEARHPVSHQRIQERLECSRATATRVISRMRLYFDAPIEYDRERNGYHYAGDGAFQLPGLWFTEAELSALLTVQKLLDEAGPGLLDDVIAPLKGRLDELLSDKRLGGQSAAERIRILRQAARPAGEYFRLVASATLQRKRLRIAYHGRGRDQMSKREVSPQRLTRYRDNWYLDAWCHESEGLRSFSVDRIRGAESLAARARSIPAQQLDRELAGSYGIFSGRPTQTAVLHFSPERARWVADEIWHPGQEADWLEDGRYELRLPYHHSEELVMQILSYGPDVEVVSPPALRKTVITRLQSARTRYADR